MEAGFCQEDADSVFLSASATVITIGAVIFNFGAGGVCEIINPASGTIILIGPGIPASQAQDCVNDLLYAAPILGLECS